MGMSGFSEARGDPMPAADKILRISKANLFLPAVFKCELSELSDPLRWRHENGSGFGLWLCPPWAQMTHSDSDEKYRNAMGRYG